ncbi:hypothetical protein [Pyxidicoccus sp. MSG2]|uniref:hypothetical protein n=1 Tax=Pyxidicoccus sp. MSG2 TaxID=2996790 RepID=UPI0022716A0B|nr:hypothetical protein [Pyxidicoccus sp. MSG2]MCY1018862.1 hypothetical protein [Pyxidicoccus sp. MSG2]
MTRTYSFDHFQPKKPVQAAIGTPGQLGTNDDKQKPLKSELQATQPDNVPGAHQGGIHYGMAHSETVKRLQERRAARAKKEARAKAATKRPSGARKAATKGSGTAKAKTARTAKTARAKPASKTAKKATAGHTTAKTARKKTAKRAEPASERTSAPAKRTEAAPKRGLLGRVVGTALATGSKGLARATALAKEVRAGKGKTSKTTEKADKSSKRGGASKKKR